MGEDDREPPNAVIFGLSGPVLRDDEAAFFADADPLGFILFARNCQSPDQVRRLIADLRAVVGRGDAHVLIDQEGGRVARLATAHVAGGGAAGGAVRRVGAA